MRTIVALMVTAFATLAVAAAPTVAPPAQPARTSAANSNPTPPDAGQPTPPPAPVPANASGCTAAKCHTGIEPIRERSSGMAQAILAKGRAAGDPAGCVVCHGGNPRTADKKAGHTGTMASLARIGGPKGFFPDPGSPWVNRESCGQCHPRQVASQWNSLMMSEAGKIQGVAWAFGALNGYKHTWGNYDAKVPADAEDRLGTPAYRRYMERLRKLEPNVYPDRMTTVPSAPSDPAEVRTKPERAAFTYLRSECQRCHLGVKGRQTRGDYRGMGCSACHIPYGNEGHYEGKDPSIPRNKKGHLLLHSIQSSRKTKLTVNGKTWSGIPVETCTTCHDRGKRIGVSFQGLMESAFRSPYTKSGKGQPKLHTKKYIALQKDHHYEKGMMCLDCHTSIDVHGDKFLFGANLAQVQIECTDCHGTPSKYPWELPLGTGEEYGGDNKHTKARGLARTLPAHLRQATVYPVEDGYLLTARGNPFRNVVRRGDRVVVRTAGGKDLVLEPLKWYRQRANKLSLAGRVAMLQVDRHLDRMECYACHGSWAPQCYGCHAKIDYSRGRTSFDWTAAGHRHAQSAHRTDRGETGYPTRMPGKVHEERSYMRWAEPMLVINGEGRVSPATPGCQVSVTVVGPDGKPIIANKVFRTPADTEGGGKQGQLSLDMSPTQPHTTAKRARRCESCHASPKALGYGISGGRLSRPWNKTLTVDLKTADGRLLPKHTQPQIEAVQGLADDWSRIVTEKGEQRMTVGHHFSRSRPLNNAERANMSREGICLSCHKSIPKQSLAVGLLHHIAKATGQLPRTPKAHDKMVHRILLTTAWFQVGMMLLGFLLGIGGTVVGVLYLKRRRRNRDIPEPESRSEPGPESSSDDSAKKP